MTPQGPAVIQVIDIPAGPLGAYGGGPGAPAPRKVGGINIMGAILRRWWLVVIVTVLIGGAGIYVGNNFVKPAYIAHCKISWIDRTGGGDGQGMQRLISQATDVLTSREIPSSPPPTPRCSPPARGSSRAATSATPPSSAT